MPTYLSCSTEAGPSSTLQKEGLTNEGRHHLLLLHKQVAADDKKGIAELLHAHTKRVI